MTVNVTDICFYKGTLFKDVQQQHIFTDQKTFADAIPLFDTDFIEARYSAEKNTDGFNLKTFVLRHFTIPQYQPGLSETGIRKPIKEYIISLWNSLTRVNKTARGSLLALPHPYVAPGGRFDELYYWDSYFTMLGLSASNRLDLVESMIENFTFLIHTIGHIPNGTRNYYLTRSQIPFYAAMIKLLQPVKGNIVLGTYLSAMEKEYAFWMSGYDRFAPDERQHRRVVQMDDGSVLNRYWDEEDVPRPEGYAFDAAMKKGTAGFYRNIRAACESGWDFSSRWFEDEKSVLTICTTDIIPVDLNCMILLLEKTLLEAYEYTANAIMVQQFKTAISARIQAINKYLWDEEAGVYKDFNFKKQKNTKALTLAMLFPLFIEISTQKQACSVLAFVKERMLNKGGMQTTVIVTSQQWDASNGWAPLQWIGYKSALNYNDKILANAIKENWMYNLEAGYEQTGKLMEKYPVTGKQVALKAGGEYLNQDGFGWTNGVYLNMAADDMKTPL